MISWRTTLRRSDGTIHVFRVWLSVRDLRSIVLATQLPVLAQLLDRII